jgi:hypothetical protein
VRASSTLEARGGFEACRHASQAADARRSASGAPPTRSCSTTANSGREATCAHRDPASHLEARCGRATRGSLEASRSLAHLSAAPCAGAVPHIDRRPLSERSQPLPDPRGHATGDLHQYLASAALGAVASEVNAERVAWGERDGSRSRANSPRRRALATDLRVEHGRRRLHALVAHGLAMPLAA